MGRSIKYSDSMSPKTDDIKKIIKNAREKVKPEFRIRVFDNDKELKSNNLIESVKPEEFTKQNIIEKIFDLFDINYSREPTIKIKEIISDKTRWPDYVINDKILVEAEPLNKTLDERTSQHGVKQIRNWFQDTFVSQNYDFGIATDGIEWAFVKPGKTDFVKETLNILNEDDIKRILELISGEGKLETINEEEISEKFYTEYNEILNGGKKIPEDSCLIESITEVPERLERENIAHIIMSRLIFIKFLQSKKIIKEDILNYISEKEESQVNKLLRELFFDVLNKKERTDVEKKFKDIPYLNGSLFERSKEEMEYPEYKVKAPILKKVIDFLDRFKFIHKEVSIEKRPELDPEILGYIFERAMTQTDRKGTGAYYTSRYITNYICENTIYPRIIDKANEFLKKEKGCKDTDLLSSIDELFTKPSAGSVREIFTNVIHKITICDPACGSGAFLLSAAEVLFDLWKRAQKEVDLLGSNSDGWIKKEIVSNNLYGVDINPNAVEIAKLRIWLWIVDSYNPEKIEPLPNIEYKIRRGNSLTGFLFIKNFEDRKQNLHDYFDPMKSLFINLKKRQELSSRYTNMSGAEGKKIKKVIDEYDRRIKALLDETFKAKMPEMDGEINLFHWGAEFYDIFKGGGFDIIMGNPPWNAVKPIEKEFFSNYDSRLTKYGVDKQEARRIIENLLKDKIIREDWNRYKTKIEIEAKYYKDSGDYKYQSEELNGKRVGGDINYYKLFLERSYQLIDNKGYIGIIVPSGIHTDAGTKGLRKLFFDGGEVISIINFENRKGIFSGIHKSFKFDLLTFHKFGSTKEFYGSFMLHDINILEQMPKKSLKIDWNLMKKLSPDSLSIIEFKSQKDIDITKKVYQSPLLKDSSWIGKVEFNREFDMTNDSSIFNTKGGVELNTEFHMTNDSNLFNSKGKGLVLYEGKMIEQYDPHFDKNRFWIDENIGREKLYGKNWNKNVDYENYRLGFRAVASSTNRRSMISSILPKNIFCGNSIIVIKMFDDNGNPLISEDNILYLCGVFNSFVFDYILRLKITTNLNMFFIYQMPVPIPEKSAFNKVIKNVVMLTDNLPEFEDLRNKYKISGKKLDSDKRLDLIAEIDSIIGKLYGLEKEDMKYILSKFKHADVQIENILRKLEKLILDKY